MSMAEDIAQIKWEIRQLGDAANMAGTIDAISDKLKYDIEPKLYKALKEKGESPQSTELTPAQKLYHMRLAIVFLTSDRLIDGIKNLRQAKGASLKEAKDTADWIKERMGIINESKEAER